MAEDSDLWRAARLLIDRYGGEAPHGSHEIARPITRPSAIGAALQIGGDVLDFKTALDRRWILNGKD